jgi:hypothetical protein
MANNYNACITVPTHQTYLDLSVAGEINVNDTVYTDVNGVMTPLPGNNLIYHITLDNAQPNSAGDLAVTVTNQGKVTLPIWICQAPTPTLYQTGLTSWLPNLNIGPSCIETLGHQVYVVMATPSDTYPSAGDAVYVDNSLQPASLFVGFAGFYRYRNATISGSGWTPIGDNFIMEISNLGIISNIIPCP